MGCVAPQADEFIQSQHEDKEYLPITGLAKFNQEAIKLAYGPDSAPLKEGRVRTPSHPGAFSATRTPSGPGLSRQSATAPQSAPLTHRTIRCCRSR